MAAACLPPTAGCGPAVASAPQVPSSRAMPNGRGARTDFGDELQERASRRCLCLEATCRTSCDDTKHCRNGQRSRRAIGQPSTRALDNRWFLRQTRRPRTYAAEETLFGRFVLPTSRQTIRHHRQEVCEKSPSRQPAGCDKRGVWVFIVFRRSRWREGLS